MREVIVVGAGAAGIFAAWRAATLGAKVTLLEKTQRIGSKILISGGGKCNIAHDGPLEEVIRTFRPNEARFIRPSCYRLDNTAIIKMFMDRGLDVYTRPNGRVFPVDKTAKEVVAILADYLREVGVNVCLETPVIGLVVESGEVVGVRTSDKVLRAEAVVVATGGSSYPKIGTTGDAWPWAAEVGHSIVKVRAALAPLAMGSGLDWSALSGIAFRDVVVKARQKGQELARWRDDLLITHLGVSGPAALGISRHIAEAAGGGEIALEVDLAPDESFETLRDKTSLWFAQNPRKQIATFIEEWMPERLVGPFLKQAGLDFGATAISIDKRGRNRLVERLKGWQIGIVRNAILEKGEVVAGGISLDEVDPQTLRSLKVEGLYLCGEALDLAGPVGGYNLQAAFATGFVAGDSAARN